MRRLGLALLGAVVLNGCDGSSVDPPVIDQTGTVGGLVYLDFDGNERLSGADEAVEGARVRVTAPGSGQELGGDVTDIGGNFLIEDIPVGTVEVGIDPAFLADSLRAVPLDSARFTLRAGGSVAVALGVTFPELPLTDVRAAEEGATVVARGVVLNTRTQSPGGAVHIEGDGVALRVLVPPSVQVAVGDSVRVQGRVGTDLGQPALLDGRFYRLVPGARDVTPRTPTMGQARAGADGLDAALVEFTSGTVVSQTTVTEGFLLTVTDGTDTLTVRLRTAHGFFQAAVPPGSQIIVLRGLLIPDPAEGTWAVVPRTTADIVLETPGE